MGAKTLEFDIFNFIVFMGGQKFNIFNFIVFIPIPAQFLVLLNERSCKYRKKPNIRDKFSERKSKHIYHHTV